MNAAGQGGVSSVDAARFELLFMSELINKMVDQCYRKCVPRYQDGELNMGESVCVDRCVGKFMDVSLRER